jgi:hypothetical protein
MNRNEVEIIDADITDLTTRPQNNGGLLDTSTDNILYMAEKAEKYIEAMNRIMEAALKITSEYDWVLIGGKPYLQESGATKIARLFGISWQMIGGVRIETDADGYKTFTYHARFMLKDQFIECEGSRSMKDDFFAKTKNGLKKPDEIDERNVKMSAYTNCINNGIKRLIPNLRNIDVSVLADAGLDVNKMQGYTFKTGSKGGSTKKAEDTGLTCEVCGAAIEQKVASYSQSYFGGHMYCRECQKKAKNGNA